MRVALLDIVGFSKISRALGAKETIAFLVKVDSFLKTAFKEIKIKRIYADIYQLESKIGLDIALEAFLLTNSYRVDNISLSFVASIGNNYEEARKALNLLKKGSKQKLLKYDLSNKAIKESVFFLDEIRNNGNYDMFMTSMLKKVLEILELDEDIELTVNIEPNDWESASIMKALEEVAKKARGRLTIEILETPDIESEEALYSFVRRFATLMCSFALDDFGSGHSNLLRLAKIKPDIIKIDRGLVEACQYDERNLDILSSIVNLAHRWGIIVIAEGIENEEMSEKIRLRGVDMMQGYHFSKPQHFSHFATIAKKEGEF